MVDILLGVCIVAVAAYLWWFHGMVMRSLGLRNDWKRRFEKMKDMLGL